MRERIFDKIFFVCHYFALKLLKTEADTYQNNGRVPCSYPYKPLKYNNSSVV